MMTSALISADPPVSFVLLHYVIPVVTETLWVISGLVVLWRLWQIKVSA